MAARLAAQLGELGIDLDIQATSSSSEFFERVLGGAQDLTLSGWIADTLDPADFLEAILASDRIPSRDNLAVAANNSRLADPAMDAALDRYRARRDGPSLAEVGRLLDELVPLLPLLYGPAATVHSFNVQGFRPSPLIAIPLAGLDVIG